MEKIIRPTVYVMNRDDVPRRPTIGKRDRFHGAFLVAEYHGRKCHQVHASSDDFGTASVLAWRIADTLDARMGEGLDTDFTRPIPKGVARLSRMPLVDVKDGTLRPPKPRQRTRRKRELVASKPLGTVKGSKMADAQTLHARDVDTLGFCQACESRNRHHVCGGKPEGFTQTVDTPNDTSDLESRIVAMVAGLNLN